MDRLLSQIFRYVPEWVFVGVILCGAIYYFMTDQPIYSPCDAQVKEFYRGQSTNLGRLTPARRSCISSLRGFGCMKYFEIFESAVRDFNKLEKKCLQQLSTDTFIYQAFSQYLRTMAMLAWGDRPPGSQFEKVGELSPMQLKTFCDARQFFRLFYSDPQWNAVVITTINLLTEDPSKLPPPSLVQTEIDGIEDSVAEEEKAYKFPKARMSPEKAFELSLLSLDCLHYQ